MQTQHLCPNGHPLRKEDTVCPRCGTIASMNDAVMPPPLASDEKYPTIPGYKITAELGHGGMGIVYKAWQLELQRWVALKMIRRKDLAGPTERTRFQAEARAIARLQHGNIVQVYDVGESDSCPYFSLEYVEGGTLDAKLIGTPIPPREAAPLMAKLARTMEFAHRQGVVHRDLKPANVLLTKSGEPKIGDFGLAKRLDDDSNSGLSETGMIMGTPSYMAPEQAKGENRTVGPTADVFALGAIYYQMLTGRVPFLGATPYETMVQVIDQEPVPPRRLQPKVPVDLETITLKCLRKDASKRYAHAGELADDLDRYLNSQPIAARPVGRREKVWLWCRRNPLSASLTGLLLFAFVLGFIAVTGMWLRAEAATRRTDAALKDLAAQQEKTEEKSRLAEANEKKANEIAGQERAGREQLEITGYAQTIQQAQREWNNGNALFASELLERCPPHLRGWEWQYLRNLQSNAQIFRRRYDAQNWAGITYHPDGKTIAVSGTNGYLSTRDAKTGEFVHSYNGQKKTTYDVAFTRDGTKLAAVAEDKVLVWDVAKRKVLRTFEGFADLNPPNALPVVGQSVAFSNDGKYIAYGTKAGFYLRRMDPSSPQIDYNFLESGTRAYLSKLAFSPDSQTIASGYENGDVAIYNVIDGKRVRTLPVSKEGCLAVAFSPDGNCFAAAGRDGLVKIFDAKSFNLMHTHKSRGLTVINLAFSPNSLMLAYTGMDNTVKVLDVKLGVEYLELRGSTRSLYGIAFSPDNKHLAAIGSDHYLRVWDVSRSQETMATMSYFGFGAGWAAMPSGAEIVVPDNRNSSYLRSVVWSDQTQELSFGNTNFPVFIKPMGAVAVSVDGRYLAVSEGYRDKADVSPSRIMIHEKVGKSFDPNPKILEGHSSNVMALAFHPQTSTVLASSGRDKKIKLWDVSDPSAKPIEIGETEKEVSALAFSADGKWLVVAGRDRIIARWSIPNKSWHENKSPVQDRDIRCLAVSPDGQWIASWAGYRYRDPGPIVLWDPSGKTVVNLDGHFSSVNSLAFHPTEQRLASLDDHGYVKIWDLKSKSELASWRGHTRAGDHIGFTPDGRFLITSGDDYLLHFWNGSNTNEIWALRGHTYPSTGVAFSTDGLRIFSTGRDFSLRMWDVRQGKQLFEGGFPNRDAHKSVVTAVAVSPDGKTLATTSNDNTAAIWSIDGKKLLTLEGHKDHVRWAAYSPDSARLATAGDDGAVIVWNVADGKPLHRLEKHESSESDPKKRALDLPVNTVAYSPDGKTIASCGNDSTVRLCDSDSGELIATLRGHTKHVTDVVYSSDGKRIASGDSAGTIIIWHAATRLNQIEFKAHGLTIQSLAFHPRRPHLLASVSDDGSVRLWDVSTPKVFEVARFPGHIGAGHGLAFSPDGTLLASTGQDNLVRVWDTSGY